MHASIHACMHACMHYITLRYVTLHYVTLHYVTLHTLHTCLPTYIRIRLHTYIHTYIPTYLHTYIHTYLHTYIPTYLSTYLHTYMYTIHVYNYIYTWFYMYYWYLYHKHSCFHHPPSDEIFVSRWWWSVDWSSMLDEVGKNFAVRHGHERGDPGSWVAESWVPPMTGNGETGNHSTYIYKNADDWGMVFWILFYRVLPTWLKLLPFFYWD